MADNGTREWFYYIAFDFPAAGRKGYRVRTVEVSDTATEVEVFLYALNAVEGELATVPTMAGKPGDPVPEGGVQITAYYAAPNKL